MHQQGFWSVTLGAQGLARMSTQRDETVREGFPIWHSQSRIFYIQCALKSRGGLPLSKTSLIPIERIEKVIYLIRGEKVMLDRDLARLYDVTTAALNQAVRRNRERFPEDFMFQLTPAEVAQLNRSQVVIGSEKHRDPRFRPYAFTEQGVAMLSSVLRSKRAITVNIEIMRAFVKLRQMLASNAELSRRLDWGSSPTVREGAAVQGCL